MISNKLSTFILFIIATIVNIPLYVFSFCAIFLSDVTIISFPLCFILPFLFLSFGYYLIGFSYSALYKLKFINYNSKHYDRLVKRTIINFSAFCLFLLILIVFLFNI